MNANPYKAVSSEPLSAYCLQLHSSAGPAVQAAQYTPDMHTFVNNELKPSPLSSDITHMTGWSVGCRGERFYRVGTGGGGCSTAKVQFHTLLHKTACQVYTAAPHQPRQKKKATQTILLYVLVTYACTGKSRPPHPERTEESVAQRLCSSVEVLQLAGVFPLLYSIVLERFNLAVVQPSCLVFDGVLLYITICRQTPRKQQEADGDTRTG